MLAAVATVLLCPSVVGASEVSVDSVLLKWHVCAAYAGG